MSDTNTTRPTMAERLAQIDADLVEVNELIDNMDDREIHEGEYEELDFKRSELHREREAVKEWLL